MATVVRLAKQRMWEYDVLPSATKLRGNGLFRADCPLTPGRIQAPRGDIRRTNVVQVPHQARSQPSVGSPPQYSQIHVAALGCFTGNNVQPLLEYASPVWCLAAESTLKKLTPVHIAALRAAPGARPSTSRDALYVYCGVWSLETRRTFLCVSAFLRITRLSMSQHPIARSH